VSTTTDALIHLVSGSLRGWRGTASFRPAARQPEKPLQLYDIEACPYCRLVREVLTELDLDVMILPCPKNGTRFRPQAERLAGRAQFPLLVDDNTATTLLESAEIIDYLYRTYGGRGRAARGLGRAWQVATAQAASALHWRPRGMTGLRARASKAPAQPLELYSFETSPFSKPVRARLCELELPYTLRNTGKGAWSDMGPASWRDRVFKGPRGTTRNRRWLDEQTGQVQVPYLIDANTGTAMYESQAILDYLDRTYAA
jgi:glutathione S-transferase